MQTPPPALPSSRLLAVHAACSHHLNAIPAGGEHREGDAVAIVHKPCRLLSIRVDTMRAIRLSIMESAVVSEERMGCNSDLMKWPGGLY
jgi:hypothetical protein